MAKCASVVMENASPTERRASRVTYSSREPLQVRGSFVWRARESASLWSADDRLLTCDYAHLRIHVMYKGSSWWFVSVYTYKDHVKTFSLKIWCLNRPKHCYRRKVKSIVVEQNKKTLYAFSKQKMIKCHCCIFIRNGIFCYFYQRDSTTWQLADVFL